MNAMILQARPAEDTLKRLIWLYFFLLLFEGALRKWFLPFLATPLLIVRDPIALWIIATYVLNRYRFWNWYTLIFVGTTLISFVITMGYGHGNLGTALFGFRIYAVHFPLMLIIGDIFDRADVERMGEVLLYIIIPTTVLVILQFYSPQSSWVNRGVGGDLEGAGFSGAMGYSRPPGLFSFTNGNSLMYGLAGAFAMYFWRQRSAISKPMLIAATLGILIVIPLSISRTYLFQLGISFLFLAVVSITDLRSIFGFIGALIIGPVILLLLSQLGFVSTGLEVFARRFTVASEVEGGFEGTFFDRFLGGFIGPLEEASELPFWGLGLGMGTNVGSTLLTGEVTYLISEGEWGRVIGESGIVIGLINILARVQLAITLMVKGFYNAFQRNALCWMLCSFSFLNIINALCGQPTGLGFMVLSAGLTIAALNEPEVVVPTQETPFTRPAQIAIPNLLDAREAMRN